MGYIFNVTWKKNIKKIPFDIEGSDKFLWQFGVKIGIQKINIGILIYAKWKDGEIPKNTAKKVKNYLKFEM